MYITHHITRIRALERDLQTPNWRPPSLRMVVALSLILAMGLMGLSFFWQPIGSESLFSLLLPTTSLFLCCIAIAFYESPIAAKNSAKIDGSSMNDEEAEQFLIHWMVPSRLDFNYSPIINNQGHLIGLRAHLMRVDEQDQRLPSEPLFAAAKRLNIEHILHRFVLAKSQAPLMPWLYALPALHLFIDTQDHVVEDATLTEVLSEPAAQLPFSICINTAAQDKTRSKFASIHTDDLAALPAIRKAQLWHWLWVEGIADQHQLRRAQSQQCDYYSGALFGHYLTASQLIRFVAELPHAPWQPQISTGATIKNQSLSSSPAV